MDMIEIPELFNLDYADVDAMPTIESGWTADLKIASWEDGHGYKVWIERTGTDDGQPYDCQLEIELTDDGRWYTAAIVDPATADLSAIVPNQPNPWAA